MTDMGRRAWEDPKKHMKYLVRTPMGHFAGRAALCYCNNADIRPDLRKKINLMHLLCKDIRSIYVAEFSHVKYALYPSPWHCDNSVHTYDKKSVNKHQIRMLL